MDPTRWPHAPSSPHTAVSLRADPVMDRRTFLAGTGAVLLAAPLAAEAQQAGEALTRSATWGIVRRSNGIGDGRVSEVLGRTWLGRGAEFRDREALCGG